MRIGASLFLIAIGAILAWGITKHFSGIDLNAIGAILIVIGIIGLLIDLALWARGRTRTVVTHNPDTFYIDPVDPVDRF